MRTDVVFVPSTLGSGWEDETALSMLVLTLSLNLKTDTVNLFEIVSKCYIPLNGDQKLISNHLCKKNITKF